MPYLKMMYVLPLTMGFETENLLSQCFPSFSANTSFSKKSGQPPHITTEGVLGLETLKYFDRH